MDLKVFGKYVLRQFKESKARILSILIMVLLSAMVVTGLGHSGRTMRKILDEDLRSMDRPDMKITSTFGLDYEDQVIIEEIKDVDKLAYSYVLDVRDDKDQIVRLISLNDTLPSYRIEEGRLPEKPGEIALDLVLNDTYKVGDTISFTSLTDDPLNESLNDEEFQIVGFVYSYDNMMEAIRPMSLFGKKELNGFAITLDSEFSMDDYGAAYLRFKDTEGMQVTSSEYMDLVEEKKESIEDSFKNRPDIRLESIKQDVLSEISTHEDDITSAEQELEDARQKLKDGSEELDEGFDEYDKSKARFNREIANGEKELAQAKSQLDEAKKEIDSGQAKLEDGQRKLDSTIIAKKIELEEGKKELVSARVKLDEAKAQYDAGLAKLEDAFEPKRAELDAAKAKLDESRAQLDEQWAKYNAFLAQIEALEQGYKENLGLSSSSGQGAEETENLPVEEPKNPEKIEEEPADKEPDEAPEDTENPPQAEDGEGEKPGEGENPGEENPNPGENPGPGPGENPISPEELEMMKKQLAEMKAQLDAGEAEYQIGLAAYEEGKAALDAAYQDQSKELDAAKAQIDQGEAEYQANMEKINQAEEAINQASISGQKELDESKAKLEEAKTTYTTGLSDYENGMSELESQRQKGEEELKNAYKDLVKAEKELNENYQKFDEESKDAEDEISEGKQKISDAKDALVHLSPPTYLIESLDDNFSINTYRTNSIRIDRLSFVFPFFFYMVAMLVTITSMKRLIDEERGQIGTLKSLGYSNGKIASKYFAYGLIPTLIASILGSILGTTVLRKVIVNAYSKGFYITGQYLDLSWLLIIFTIIVSLLLIALTVYVAVKRVVNEVPARLLGQEAPKKGSRVFLERITPIWNRMPFLHKITTRNLFRYKSRAFMTIFGVLGSTALIFFGFAIRESIVQYSDIQFNQIMNFDLIAIYDEEANTEDLIEYRQSLKNEKTSPVYYQTGQVTKDGRKHDLNLVVSKDLSDLSKFVRIKDKKGKDLTNIKDSAIITEKIALQTGVGPGDRLKIKDSDDLTREIKIGAIAENYLNHYIYMDASYYEDVFGKEMVENADYIITDDSDGLEETLSKENAVYSVLDLHSISYSADGILEALSLVIVVIIIISSLLAVVVLYNLSYVNISERKRELSTLKVLGFYPKELTAYIYRETFILTILGILLGYVGGNALHRYIIKVVAPEQILLVEHVPASSYIVSAAITLGISIVVMLIVHKRLKNIDMVDALSANE